VWVDKNEIYLKKDGNVINTTTYDGNNREDRDQKILQIIEPLLNDLINKYEF
jgi:hypothetical protein